MTMPVEKGYTRLNSSVDIWFAARSVFSKFGTIYHGMLNKKPTPIISKLHIRINMSLNDVFTFDLPPRIWFFWKILENHRAMLTANKAFIVETASIMRAAKNDPVR